MIDSSYLYIAYIMRVRDSLVSLRTEVSAERSRVQIPEATYGCPKGKLRDYFLFFFSIINVFMNVVNRHSDERCAMHIIKQKYADDAYL